MALSKLEFTKDWSNASDFPTYEVDEAKVRADLQCLHNETKNFINSTIDALNATEIPFSETEAVSGGNVQAAIENVQAQIESAVLGNLPVGSITEEKISDSAVTTEKLADGAVNAAKIEDKSITADELADGAVISSKIASGSVTAEKLSEDIVSSISNGGINENFIHNWDFRNPVNQRGQTVYTGDGGYTIDRWLASTGMTVTLNDGYVRLRTDSQSYFRQNLEQPLLDGNEYTLSIYIKGNGGGKLRLQKLIDKESDSYGTIKDIDLGSMNNYTLISITKDPKPYNIETITVQLNADAQYDIKFIKLEKGTKSTLNSEAVRADYVAELVKCQRYYLPLEAEIIAGYGSVRTATNARMIIPTPVTMHPDSKLTLTNYGKIYNISAASLTPTAAELAAIGSGAVRVNLTVANASALTAGIWYGFDGYISADL